MDDSDWGKMLSNGNTQAGKKKNFGSYGSSLAVCGI